MSTPPTPPSPVRIVVHGATGRMGARICALAVDDRDVALAGALARERSARAGQESVPGAAARAPKISSFSAFSGPFSVLIDFSSDACAAHSLALAQRARAALLIGTTALSPATIDALRAASADIAILVAPNTSLGVTALASAVSEMARLLGASYHCSITEAHHIAKKDAPSGTALRLAEAARKGDASLPPEQILSMRGGDVIGEHTVRFAGPGEYIELTHRATTRDLFARGALTAAKWLAGRAPGWWTMNDVLGLPAR